MATQKHRGRCATKIAVFLVTVSFFNFVGEAAGAGALNWPYTQRNTNNTLTK